MAGRGACGTGESQVGTLGREPGRWNACLLSDGWWLLPRAALLGAGQSDGWVGDWEWCRQDFVKRRVGGVGAEGDPICGAVRYFPRLGFAGCW